MKIPALYVDARGPYAQDPRFDPWPRSRNAMEWDGPGPAIAHPPCGHWGRYHAVCKQPGKECGPVAFAQIRRWGGVLEHPAHSHLFRAMLAPDPGPQIDFWGGQTLLIDQADFGFPAHKPTWLYFVNARLLPLPPPSPRRTRTVECLSVFQRSKTPEDLVSWLAESLAQDTLVHPIESFEREAPR
jgi:hypothetical protein